jgi:NADH-ubiquinone oxidoreductase chain 5
LPLFLLSFGSIFIGYLSRDMFVGLGTDFWGNALFTLPSNQYLLESEWLDASVKLIPLIFSFSGVGLATYHYLVGFKFLFFLKSTVIGRNLYTFLNRKWFFDKVYNEWIAQNLATVAYKQTYQNMDRGLLEFLGPQGIATQIYLYTTRITQISLGFTYHYLFLFHRQQVVELH